MTTVSGNAQTVKENKMTYSTPEWAKHVIWYQIFPERFRNGDPSNDPIASRVAGEISLPDSWQISPWTGDWYERSSWEKKLGPSFRDGVFYRRYGGDIQGIIEKLDYLQELGIGAIYLNPVFDAVSLHKYDTSHFRHVDRFFGPDPEGDTRIIENENPRDPSTWKWTAADKLFLELIRQVHERGMKIIIDAVFNHTGTDFWAFRDLSENQRASKFRNWYDVIKFDNPETPNIKEFDYNGWWGVKDLPEFKQNGGNLVKPVREHIARITRRWMDPNGDGDPSDGVDGWRLDVPEEIGNPFWKEWCGLVRSINPEAYIVGEIWDEKAAGFLSDELFTAVMNYQFAKAVQHYFIDGDTVATEFVKKLDEVRESFPEEANLVVQNLLESHDTPRLASMIRNPGRSYDQLGGSDEGFDVRKPDEQDRQLQRLIALFQFTYIGAPMIYYGTEAGMWGADDPDNRKPMLWPDLNYKPEKTHPLGNARPADENRFDKELFNWYKKLAEIRNNHSVLQTGKFKLLEADSENDIISFVRYESKEKFCLVILNRSDQPRHVQLSLSFFEPPVTEFIDRLTNRQVTMQEGNLEVRLNPLSGMILFPEE